MFKILLTAGVTISMLSACGPAPTAASDPTTGKALETDSRIVQGKVTGTKVGSNTMVAIFGAFRNISGNRINAQNETIDADAVLAVAPVASGAYKFHLPKGPTKGNAASLDMFVFNDENNNKTYDANEAKSTAATLRWLIVGGYQSGKDADGNEVLFSDFKDFNFKFD